MIDLTARGKVEIDGAFLVGGSLGTGGRSGSAGAAGAAGSAGQPGLAGAAGAVSPTAPFPQGGNGGAGGNGGRGGDGGAGAAGMPGSAGGGGAGGSVRLGASVLAIGAATVDTAGGAGGQAGRLLLASNTAVGAGHGLAPRVEQQEGARGANPFTPGDVFTRQPEVTPYLPDLEGGAERYGVMREAADAAPFAAIVGLAPARAIAALARIVDEAAVLGVDFIGFDLIVYVNLADHALDAPGFSLARILNFGGTDLTGVDLTPDLLIEGGPDAAGDVVLARAPQSLLAGGWTRDPLFGGAGAEVLAALRARGVYATLVESDTRLRAVMTADGLVASGELGPGGGVTYLAKPVPEPATWTLVLVGTALLLSAAVRRRLAARSA
ncbi:MAG: hypothetical protein MUF30_00910 [Burkholderiales bacterium]|nr:hypothetical protein [Burkholderiales bacterium]